MKGGILGVHPVNTQDANFHAWCNPFNFRVQPCQLCSDKVEPPSSLQTAEVLSSH